MVVSAGTCLFNVIHALDLPRTISVNSFFFLCLNEVRDWKAQASLVLLSEC